MRDIVETGGAVLTELPPGSPPLPRHFPMRNRLIAGLAWGVVVVEATERSGSLITARFAAETGKEVFALPHNLTSRTGVGPNTLIQKGAKLAQRMGDILEELPEHISCRLKPLQQSGSGTNAVNPSGYSDLGDTARKILRHLSPDEAVGADALCEAAGLSPSEALAALLELQMAGACVELPGTRYALAGPRKEPA
jgi:DNA processing protein